METYVKKQTHKPSKSDAKSYIKNGICKKIKKNDNVLEASDEKIKKIKIFMVLNLDNVQESSHKKIRV